MQTFSAPIGEFSKSVPLDRDFTINEIIQLLKDFYHFDYFIDTIGGAKLHRRLRKRLERELANTPTTSNTIRNKKYSGKEIIKLFQSPNLLEFFQSVKAEADELKETPETIERQLERDELFSIRDRLKDETNATVQKVIRYTFNDIRSYINQREKALLSLDFSDERQVKQYLNSLKMQQ